MIKSTFLQVHRKVFIKFRKAQSHQGLPRVCRSSALYSLCDWVLVTDAHADQECVLLSYWIQHVFGITPVGLSVGRSATAEQTGKGRQRGRAQAL